MLAVDERHRHVRALYDKLKGEADAQQRAYNEAAAKNRGRGRR